MENYRVINKTINVLLIVLCIAAIICLFLPWLVIEGSVSVSGYGINGSSSASIKGFTGITFGAGKVILMVLSFYLYLLVNKKVTPRPLLVILPIVILFSTVFFLYFSLNSFSSSTDTSLGELKGNFQSGLKSDKDGALLYYLFFSVVIPIASIFRSKKSLAIDNSQNYREMEEGISQIDNSLPSINTKEKDNYAEFIPEQNYEAETSKEGLLTSKYIKIILGLLLIIGTSYFVLATFSGKEKESNDLAISDEKNRIENIIQDVHQAVSEKKYEQALLIVENINWLLSPGENTDYVNQYKEQRENMRQTIIRLKEEQEMQVRQEAGQMALAELEKAQNIETQTNENIDFPYTAVVKNPRAYFFDSPSINSQRQSYIIEGQEISVVKSQGDFLYGTFEYNGKLTEGWLKKEDFNSN